MTTLALGAGMLAAAVVAAPAPARAHGLSFAFALRGFAILAEPPPPLVIYYRRQAYGYVPRDHWRHGRGRHRGWRERGCGHHRDWD